ncbi:biotin-dependent carboxyltransferase family protein [Pseudoclavibacter sp. CFCC 11306]|uniref:5-oxoprolinase subunit C family protein n=1 Tax=Pseudoclavibacter sp. CFCC 11306 TaxID=1564493 RepID=UPI0013011D8F|nr:biotin-dependent carboxyltransferase family protein [Pseudoclavibacter sp. CFCC 11306]KAB1658859.1 biotin-dependent carboxyltransferase [Pseudoclavibacter sp. CFCC 11306]
MIEIKQGGLSTTVQDRGRVGLFEMGIPTGGSLDQFSAYAANLLVGNDEDAAVLECTYTLPHFSVSESTTMAVTGGTASITVNGDPVPQWQAVSLSAGSEVSFGLASLGSRVYIAFAGGIDVPVVFGSRSTYLAGALGGYQGRKLETGDQIELARPQREVVLGRAVPDQFRLAARKSSEVRVVPGLHVERLSEESRETLFSANWKLTPLGDRSGMRYSGPHIDWELAENYFGAGSDPSNIVDAGYPLGAIEIPGGNEPILLHRDAPTEGGYAMIGVTARADMDIVGQQMPGEQVQFRAVSLDQALEAWGVYRRQWEELTAALR